MTIALHGNLRDFGIGEVFQLIGQQRKTGVLEVRGPKGEVTLRFDDGSVVSAAPVSDVPDAALSDMIGALRGRAARSSRGTRARSAPCRSARRLRRRRSAQRGIAARSRGSADARDDLRVAPLDRRIVPLRRAVDSARSPGESLLAAEQVLMDGLRMVDEWQAFERSAGRDGGVPASRQHRGVSALGGRSRGSVADRVRACVPARGRPRDGATRDRPVAPRNLRRDAHPRAAAALRLDRTGPGARRRRDAQRGARPESAADAGSLWWRPSCCSLASRLSARCGVRPRATASRSGPTRSHRRARVSRRLAADDAAGP